MVSVLTIGSKVRGFKPSQGDGFLRAIKVRSKTFFGGKVNLEAPCRKTLRHVKKTLGKYEQILPKAKFSLLSPIPPDCYQKYLLVGLQRALVDKSGVFLCRHNHSTMVLHIHMSLEGWWPPFREVVLPHRHYHHQRHYLSSL
jgi:hypothetical protein